MDTKVEKISSNIKKTKVLRNIITDSRLSFLMEAHDGISAKIVEETGFSGIWASGLGISAALGVRDNNELSWTQVCEMCEYMTNVTNIPILLDGDTGYGNFNNFRILIRKLEQIGVAGVCIEDKIFPKKNSFIKGEKQNLTSIEEFCGKIRAGKDVIQDKDFVIVARTEAFIVGLGVSEAIKRAKKYVEAGADAILVHSKREDSKDIDAFMKEWGDAAPIIIVPTMYYQVPTSHFTDIGISTVIWANQNIRAATSAMEKISKTIYESYSISEAENEIVPVKEIFRLQDIEKYEVLEQRFSR